MTQLPAGAPHKRCTVAWATPAQQQLWNLELPPGATIADALAAAQRAPGAAQLAIPWDTAEVGVFGEPRRREEVFADGDRIELYRPLHCDPRERRRERVQRERKHR
jgi:putative ubiquitin-RnfH superfamily antitoxin RatB of RatAB toxin-antitoxin module